ncbi:Hypothetical protein GSB_152154 [Giardia duodenalis]|uniref:Uncharacterized protein n=2 Tax=Giardia intestinalis TaxID=5741 RepID=C6LP54_GIAIB|nr:Hypothetical protein GL50581_517 [Giardia intestinalis ATCC 50581]ESU41480.1 Hypothetical protein GSB_152154 [Giardia intestinalis]
MGVHNQVGYPQHYSTPSGSSGGLEHEETLKTNRFGEDHKYTNSGTVRGGNSLYEQTVNGFEASIRRSLTIKIYLTLAIMIMGTAILTIGLYILLTTVIFKVYNGVIQSNMLLAYFITEVVLAVVGSIGFVVISCINACCMDSIGKCGTITLLILGPVFSSMLFTSLSMLTSIVIFGSSLLCVLLILIFCTSVALCIKSETKVWVMILIAVGCSQLLWLLYPILFVWNLFTVPGSYSIISIVISVLLCLIYTLYLVIDIWLALNKSACSDWAKYVLKIYSDVVYLLISIMRLMGSSRR